MITKYDYGIIVSDQVEELDIVLDRLLQSGNSVVVQSCHGFISQPVISLLREYIPFGVEYIEYPVADANRFYCHLSNNCEEIIDLHDRY